MRRTFISIFLACLLIGSAVPLASGKKKKDKFARLKTLQTISVEGSPMAVAYIRKNLSQKTCLIEAPQDTEPDAILDVRQALPSPCGGSGMICSAISVQLLDPKTDHVLWFVEDDNLPQVDRIHGLNGPYDWVLWNLNSACCKGRPTTPPPLNPKD